MSLVIGVTKDNYGEKGSKFIELNGKKGFVISRHGAQKGKDVFAPTLKQWAAWRRYFVGKGIDVRWFDTRDYYTVPAEWPHLFDAEATVAGDYAAEDLR